MRFLFLALTALNYISYCSSRFFNNKKWLLALDIFAKCVTILSFIVVKEMTAIFSVALWAVWMLIVFARENSKIKWPMWLNAGGFVLFVIIYIVVTIVTYSGIGSILVSVTAVLALIANWWFRPQIIRFIGFFAIAPYLIYQLSLQNWVALVGEILVFVSTLIPFVMYIINNKTFLGEKSNEEKN